MRSEKSSFEPTVILYWFDPIDWFDPSVASLPNTLRHCDFFPRESVYRDESSLPSKGVGTEVIVGKKIVIKSLCF
jgi:hypothetical protein